MVLGGSCAEPYILWLLVMVGFGELSLVVLVFADACLGMCVFGVDCGFKLVVVCLLGDLFL